MFFHFQNFLVQIMHNTRCCVVLVVSFLFGSICGSSLAQAVYPELSFWLTSYCGLLFDTSCSFWQILFLTLKFIVLYIICADCSFGFLLAPILFAVRAAFLCFYLTIFFLQRSFGAFYIVMQVLFHGVLFLPVQFVSCMYAVQASLSLRICSDNEQGRWNRVLFVLFVIFAAVLVSWLEVRICTLLRLYQ